MKLLHSSESDQGPVLTLPGSAVGAGFAVLFGANDPGPLVREIFESTALGAGLSLGAGDSFAEQPAVSPMPTIASPPVHNAIRRAQPEFSTRRTVLRTQVRRDR